MTDDRNKGERGNGLKTLGSEETIPADRPAIGGSSDGRDAALRSDTDRSDASPAAIRDPGSAGEAADEDRAATPAGSTDAGSPGGMGGAGASTNRIGRPPGGESPGKSRKD